MRRKYFIVSMLLSLFAIIVILNISASTFYGKNYIVYKDEIPFYAKLVNFYSRHFEYKNIADKITRRSTTDKEKVLRIFDWIRSNVRRDFPKDWPILDDHILYTMVRGYGAADQIVDAFVTLTSYEGMKGTRYHIYTGIRRKFFPIALVEVDGRILVFDPAFGNYFVNENGEIASIKDIIRNPSLVEKAKNKPVIRGIAYTDYFRNLRDVDRLGVVRADLQMPGRRFFYEAKRVLGFISRRDYFYANKKYEEVENFSLSLR